MVAKGYCTTAMVADFLGITFTPGQETYCATLVERAERFLDEECRRAWLVGVQTDEAHYQPLGHALYLAYPPVSVVTEVKGRQGLTATESVLVEGEDYEVRDPDAGLIWLVYPSLYDRVRVTYTPVDEVPSDVQQAMVELVADWMQPSLSGTGLAGVESYRLPDLEVRFARRREGQRVPDKVQAVIDHYRFGVVG